MTQLCVALLSLARWNIWEALFAGQWECGGSSAARLYDSAVMFTASGAQRAQVFPRTAHNGSGRNEVEAASGLLTRLHVAAYAEGLRFSF